MQLGDMHVLDQPSPKMAKALAVIADRLHAEFLCDPGIAPGISRRSCVLCSLTVATFLRDIGFADATVRPVAVVMYATRDGRLLHSLGMGVPHDERRTPGDWPGHMVAVAEGWLIDTTLYPAIRPQWADVAPMMAAPIDQPAGPRQRVFGLPVLRAASAVDEAGYEFNIAWLDNPDNRSWRNGPDARDSSRRVGVIKTLVECFGSWQEAAA